MGCRTGAAAFHGLVVTGGPMSAMTRRLFSKGVTSVTCTAGRARHSGGMKQLDIQTFHDFSDDEISRRILMENPVMRVVLVSMRAGQSLPEHAANGLVTVYSVSGHALFLSLIHISEPTRLGMISYAVF